MCRENELVGIGSRDRARPLIKDIVCRGNKLAGIGVEHQSEATILGNKCLDNGTVAIGVRHESSALIRGNELERRDGMPPLIEVRETSSATILDNQLRGGGVAGVLVDGRATISGNTFVGNGLRGGGPPNFAVWVQKGATVTVTRNDITAWRHAVHADGAQQVTVTENSVRKFLVTAIVVMNSTDHARVTGNVAFSDNPSDKAVSIDGPQQSVEGNELKRPPSDGGTP